VRCTVCVLSAPHSPPPLLTHSPGSLARTGACSFVVLSGSEIDRTCPRSARVGTYGDQGKARTSRAQNLGCPMLTCAVYVVETVDRPALRQLPDGEYQVSVPYDGAAEELELCPGVHAALVGHGTYDASRQGARILQDAARAAWRPVHERGEYVTGAAEERAEHIASHSAWPAPPISEMHREGYLARLASEIGSAYALRPRAVARVMVRLVGGDVDTYERIAAEAPVSSQWGRASDQIEADHIAAIEQRAREEGARRALRERAARVVTDPVGQWGEGHLAIVSTNAPIQFEAEGGWRATVEPSFSLRGRAHYAIDMRGAGGVELPAGDAGIIRVHGGDETIEITEGERAAMRIHPARDLWRFIGHARAVQPDPVTATYDETSLEGVARVRHAEELLEFMIDLRRGAGPAGALGHVANDSTMALAMLAVGLELEPELAAVVFRDAALSLADARGMRIEWRGESLSEKYVERMRAMQRAEYAVTFFRPGECHRPIAAHEAATLLRQSDAADPWDALLEPLVSGPGALDEIHTSHIEAALGDEYVAEPATWHRLRRFFLARGFRKVERKREGRTRNLWVRSSKEA
jgi:hypothetical protein